MHVLIVAGEELNPNNIFASIFELQQAQALINCGVTVRILSFRVAPSIFKIKNIKNFKFLDVLAGFENKLHKIENCDVQETVIISRIPSRFIKNISCLYRRASINSIKKYITRYGTPDLIHAHSRFLIGGLVALEISDKLGIPYIVTEHSSFFNEDLVNKDDIKKIIIIINKAKKWIVVSDHLGNTILNLVQNELNKDFVTIPNIVDNSLFEEQERREESKEFSFLAIGSLDDNKNHSFLIHCFYRTFKNQKNIKLKIIGKGPNHSELTLLIKSLRMENQISLLGHVGRDEIRQSLYNCDCLVLPSKIETFGVVIIEAMACGKPVISSKSGGPDSIISEENGILIDVNNTSQMCRALEIMVNEIATFDKIRIREYALKNFGQDSFVNKITHIYKEIVGQKV